MILLLHQSAIDGCNYVMAMISGGLLCQNSHSGLDYWIDNKYSSINLKLSFKLNLIDATRTADGGGSSQS